MKRILLPALLLVSISVIAQQNLTPELLWKLGRMSAVGITTDKTGVVYNVSTPNVQENSSSRKMYYLPLSGGAAREITDTGRLVRDSRISPDGRYRISSRDVKLQKVFGKDYYPDLQKSTAQVYDQLNYRHWDEWEDGAYSHIFVQEWVNGAWSEGKDIMEGQMFDSPQKPFGGDEDFIWSPDSKAVIYVTKPKSGTAYAVSTNTDIFRYDIATGKTINLTAGNMGYDVNPAFSSKGTLAWLSMRREGFEADKQDIVILQNGRQYNLTVKNNAIHVQAFKWSSDGETIYFLAPVKSTQQLFQVRWNPINPGTPTIRQITKGDHQITDIVGEVNGKLITSVSTFNSAPELYSINAQNGSMQKISAVNDHLYSDIAPVTARMRMVRTADHQLMPTWVIYPPHFDSTKQYPTLLFCLGGPQGTTPHYSYRWNLQLMASQGYIVVAPDRRGVYGNGTRWTEQVSKDWGGLVMKDYLSAIDDVSKEKYVDKSRRGCVGASFGGYSAFYLAAIHNGRFKTFISHDGVFDTRSMSGTTEELWFTNWDLGGNYWEKTNKLVQKAFTVFNPSEHVSKWTAPILIVQGGKDYRVPIEQGLMAFHAAQTRGIKSRLLYLPDENHWVLKPQNAIVWQREFFRWLNETMPARANL